MSEEKETWKLDKHIPVVPMLSLVITVIGMVWWISAWMTAIELRISSLEVWWRDAKTVTTDVAVMKNEITNISKTLVEIKDELKDQSSKLEELNDGEVVK